jgi:hypothetical protein
MPKSDYTTQLQYIFILTIRNPLCQWVNGPPLLSHRYDVIKVAMSEFGQSLLWSLAATDGLTAVRYY